MGEVFQGKPLPSGWLVYTTDDGRPYFHNKVSASTQWTAPNSNNNNNKADDVSSAPSRDGNTVSSSAGAIFEPEKNSNLDDDDVTGDGEIATGSRMINFETDGQARQVVIGNGHHGGGLNSGSASKKKKGYASLPEGFIESGGKGMPSVSAAGSSESVSNADDTFCFFFSLRSLQSYFDVSTQSVINKLTGTFQPHKIEPAAHDPEASSSSSSVSFISTQYRNHPDLYGPFWLTTTLIFFLFAASNTAAFASGHTWRTEYLTLIVSVFLMYSYLIVVPLLGWALVTFLGGQQEKENISFRQLIGVYGYSFTICAPVAVLSIIPSMGVRWLFAAVGAAFSVLFLLLNFKRDLIQAEQTFKLALLGLLVAAQITLYASFPLYLFNV